MKLLHTGDWHLGRRLHGVDRREEQRAALAEVAQIAGAEEVDAVLVAGDLLERRVVETEPLSDCLDALDALGRVAPVIAVVGNHDDPVLWERLAPYLSPGGVQVVARPAAPSDAVRSIDTASGPLHVACLPWLEVGRMPIELGASAATARGSYADRVREIVKAYADTARDHRERTGGVAVLLAHLMVDRARAGGGERELTIGVTYAISGEAIPADLDYVALGHVHRAQLVPGLAGPGRYSGAPLVLDFADEGSAPSVAIAHIGGTAHEVETRVLETPHRLVRLRGSLDAVAAAAGDHERSYFHCQVEVDSPSPDLVERVRELIPTALRVEPRYPETDEIEAPSDRSEEPRDLGALYEEWRAGTGAPADPLLVGALREALAAGEPGRPERARGEAGSSWSED